LIILIVIINNNNNLIKNGSIVPVMSARALKELPIKVTEGNNVVLEILVPVSLKLALAMS